VRQALARAILLALGLSLVMAAVAWRVVSEGHSELGESEAAYAGGDLASATVHARRAAAAYVPFAAHVPRAYERLRSLAAEAERRGDHEAALFAWRAVRSAAISSRWLVIPFPQERRDADAAIVRLSTAVRDAAPSRTPSAPGTRRLAAALAADEGPPRAAGLLMLGGLACFVAGGVWITGSPEEVKADTLARRVTQVLSRARGAPIVLLVAGIVGWVAGWLWG
jgi:hypothetical protein